MNKQERKLNYKDTDPKEFNALSMAMNVGNSKKRSKEL